MLCAKILINAGIVEIVFGEPYPDPLSEEMLAESGVVGSVRRDRTRGEPAVYVVTLQQLILDGVALARRRSS